MHFASSDRAILNDFLAVAKLLVFILWTAKQKPHYRLVMRNTSWGSAAKYCERLHPSATLAVIRSAEEQKAVSAYLSRNYRKYDCALQLCCQKLTWLHKLIVLNYVISVILITYEFAMNFWPPTKRRRLYVV